jgi:hypothetical protein
LGLLALGLLLTVVGKTRDWSRWKIRIGYGMMTLAGLWVVAVFATDFLGLGRSRPVFVYNFLDLERFRWEALAGLGAGEHTIVFDFKYDGPGPAKGGTGVLSIDGKEAVRKKIPHTIPLLMPPDETFDIGLDTRTPVDFTYEVPFRFTGTIDKLNYKLGPEQLSEPDKEAAAKVIARARD